MTSDPPANPASGGRLPKRRRGESLRATRPTPPSGQASGPQQPVRREQQPPAGFAWQTPHTGAAHLPAGAGDPGAGATDPTAQPSSPSGFAWFASSTASADPATASADQGTGRTTRSPQTDFTLQTPHTGTAHPAAADQADRATGRASQPSPQPDSTWLAPAAGPATTPADPATGRTTQASQADFAWPTPSAAAQPTTTNPADRATGRASQPSPQPDSTWLASAAGPATTPADPATGRTTQASQADFAWPTPSAAAQPATTNPAGGATGLTRRPAQTEFATPTTATGGLGTAQPARPTDPATGRTAQSPQADFAWPTRATTAGGLGTSRPTTPTDAASGRTAQAPQADFAWATSATAAQQTAADPAEGATALRQPAQTEFATPTTTAGGPGTAQSGADSARAGRSEAAAAAALTLPPPAPQPKRHGRAARVPVRRRVANGVLGIVLLAAAVALQTAVLHEDDRDAPITSSGTAGEMVDTAFFGAKVESVEVARALQEENRERVDPSPGQLFVVVKVRATGKMRALQLKWARLVTADGLKYEATERVLPTRTLAHKWVQPMLWSSGLVFFEVPPEALPGASVVVAENQHPLFGDQYMIEASIDLGLDEAKARAAVDSATSVYRIPAS